METMGRPLDRAVLEGNANMNAQAAILAAPRGAVQIAEVGLQPPGPGEAMVRMLACGICHSDVMIAGLEKLPLAPLILGHEAIGVVESVGEGVTNVAPGDRVGVTYLASACGACEACLGGRERFCLKQQNHGYSRHGALTTRGVMAAGNLIRVPESLSGEEAAPLCCAGWTAMGALREAGLERGQLLAIFGMGGLGHLALQYALHDGLRVVAADVSEEKLEFARQLGAESAVLVEQSRKEILKDRGGADAAIVFAASANAAAAALACLKRCGRLILVGLTADAFPVSVNEMVLKGIRIQGSYLGTRADLEHVFELATGGVARPKVTVYPLDRAPELIERLRRGELTGRAVVCF